MVSFLVYDIVFLVAFIILFSIFLYRGKKNIKREGLLILYRTQWGMKLINWLGKKHPRTLKVLSWVSIIMGYLLMIGMFWLTYRLIAIYFFRPDIVRAIKVPPIIPLVPYLPQVFRLDFLPPFFFTYWIVILAVIAIPHELAHGVFAAYNKVKIKSTGFAFFPWFLPIFPAAFVEQDEKSMEKANNFKQMAILSAGTFANVITAFIFFLIMAGFFALAFIPAGIQFDSFATSQFAVAGVTSIAGNQVMNPDVQELLNYVDEEGLTELRIGENTFLVNKQILESQIERENIIVYHDSPALENNLSSIILEINDVQITSVEGLQTELSKYSPGEDITITTLLDETTQETEVTLEEHPLDSNTAWLGIGFLDSARGGALGKVVDWFTFKEPNTYYQPVFDGLSVFIYNLLWWLVLMSISVALINMLPVGIFDGGRFFYLTVLGLTKNEKIARQAFSFMTWFFLFLLFLIMVFWAVSWF